MGQLSTALIAALVLSMFTFSGQAAAWSTPTLTASCAPDATHYGWSVNLPHESNYKIDTSWNSSFSGATTMDLGTAGAHSFTTARGGAKLYVRWTSDHNVSTSATASSTLCASGNGAGGTGGNGGTVAGSQTGPNGNNGDVKIHAAGTSADDHRNEPHVCAFYLDAFNFDANSSGTWSIEKWAPTGSGVVASGSWGPADASGNWHSGTMTLPNGHYKLFFKQTGTPGGEKQKVFWVECGSAAGSDSDKDKDKDKEDNTVGGTQQSCFGTAALKSHSDIEGATQGGTATVTFTMSNGCTGKELSLVSYKAPSAEFSRDTAPQQQLFEAKTGTFANGVFTLAVHVPSCFYQVDFVMGKPITQFGGSNFYSDQGRLIAGVNGGTTSCTETSANGGGSTTVTPSDVKTGTSEESKQPGDTEETTTPGSTTETSATTTPANGNAVAGFQTPPSGNNAVGSVSPIVEVPGGSNQQSPNGAPAGVQNGAVAGTQNGTVAGVQNGPVAGVQSLPSTSTDRTPVMPLAAMGLAIMALGATLLRRRDPQL